jgi:hypothetical protein
MRDATNAKREQDLPVFNSLTRAPAARYDDGIPERHPCGLSDDGTPGDLVTLDQIAAAAGRSRWTLKFYLARRPRRGPEPVVRAGYRGRPYLWSVESVRPWMTMRFGRCDFGRAD